MAKLLGFQKTSSGADIAKTIQLIEKSYLNRTTGGEFNNTEEVQGLIDVFSKLPKSQEVEIKLADLKNKQLQIQGKLTDILSQKNVFEMDLRQGLDNAAQNNFKDMRSLIGSYAAIYGDAADRYDGEVLSDIAKRYGTTGNIPDETLKYRNTLNEKAKFYAELFNSYNMVDERTGELGSLDTSGIAVQLDTNPTTGAVSHLEIVPSSEVDNKTYLRTDVGLNVMDNLPNKKIPVYMRTNPVAVTADGKQIRGGKLGNIDFEETMNSTDGIGTQTAGILSPKRQGTGFSGLNPFYQSPEEKLNESIDSIKQNGVRFSNDTYRYDSQDIPNDNILKMGNRLFYSTAKDGEVLEIDGKDLNEKADNLNKYLRGIGKEPEKMAPYFITRDYLNAPDGGSRVKGKIDQNYFATPSAPSQPTSFTTVAPTGGAIQQPTPVEPSSFFADNSLRVNRQNKPDEPAVGDQSKYFGQDLIDKGMSFFRGKQ